MSVVETVTDPHAGLPDGWVQVTIGSVARVQRGASPRPISDPKWFDTSSPIGWVRISDATAVGGRVLTDTADHLSPAGVENSRLLPAGSLIMSICATIGVPVITGFDACIHDGFVGITDLHEVDQLFLLFKLRQLEPIFRTLGQTGSQANLNSDLVRECSISMPADISEQRAIAEVLADLEDAVVAMDALIDKKRRVGEALIEAVAGGTAEWVRRDGSSSDVPLGELCVLRRERWDSMPSGALRVDLDHLEGGGTGQLLRALEADAVRDSHLRKFDAGDVLFGRLRAYLRKTWFADRPGVCTTEIWPLRAIGAAAAPAYLAQLLRSDRVVSAASVSQGTHMPRSDWPTVARLRIPVVPSLDEQERIGRICADFDQEIQALRGRRSKLLAIQEATAHDLLSGRVRLR